MRLLYVFFVTLCTFFYAHPTGPNLDITKQKNTLVAGQIDDNSEEFKLVDISKINKNIIVDIKYATGDNVMGKAVYASNKCFLRKHIALELDKIQKELEPIGLGLKIFDAFRPMSVQALGHKMFPTYFASPNRERAKHPRGTAVDLTLVDKDGNEILMPTPFDTFSHKASRACRRGLPKAAVENREILETIMAKHGFIGLAIEWWHFDHWTWKMFPVINDFPKS